MAHSAVSRGGCIGKFHQHDVLSRSQFGFLVGAFRRKTQTIVVTSFFKTNELTDFINFISWPTNTKLPLLPHYFTATWHRGYGFFEVCQAEGHGFESRPWPKFFCAIFFRLCETFFRKYLQRVHPSFFCLFCKKWMFKDSQSAPFYMFRHYATYRKPKKIEKKFKKFGIFFPIFPQAGTVEENTWHFEVLLLFLSLRYGADLGRSRLVSSFFDALPGIILYVLVGWELNRFRY